MRRSALAVALLLATAPVAGATEISPEVKPELRAVEVATPTIRKQLNVAPARAEEVRKVRTSAVQEGMSTTTIVILVLAAIGAIAVLAAVL